MGDTIAVIGLGTMGGGVAERLVTVGAAVRGYDPAPEARERASRAGVSVHESAVDALPGANVVVLSLPGPEDVVRTASEMLGNADRDAVIVDLSSIDPDSARQAASSVPHATYLDAPVLGRPDRCGHWTLVAGGPTDAIDRVRPLLESTIARKVAHIGEVGSGSVVKLLNNLMFGAINAVTAEALEICERAGVDPELFTATVADSGAATVSGLFRELGGKIPAGDYSPSFALGLLQKDNRLALRLAERTGSPGFVAHCVDQLNTLATTQGWAREDTAAVHRLYRMLTTD